ncbi:hypothetical protein DFH29DRAFT_999071 [Suillus ampliporus]|nr:hypothetical protein DFH29DRAFT_999071 [Suillus ampliporus]
MQITDSSTLKPSYATALKTGNHSHQDQELQTQISHVLAAGKSSHAQLVERIRKALTNIPKDNDNIEFNIKAIMQFKQGGMVIEFTTKEAADYIHINEETKNLFLKHLDPDATLKERTYPVVIPFMPISFDPTSKDALKALEKENDPKIANIAIRDGITSNQLKLWPKKNRREPIRNKNYCMSCETEDHSSWSCDCPTFRKKCDDTDKRYPKNAMPFFPTNENWTHATAPPKPAPYRKPPPPPSNQLPTLTQRTLDSFPTRPNHGTRREREAEPSLRGPTHNQSNPHHSQPPQWSQDFFSNLDFMAAANHDTSGWND